MPRFEFVARDPRGREVRGVRDEASPGVLVADLRREGLVALRVSGEAEGGAGPRRASRGPFGPRTADVELELRQLAFMLRSGVTILNALRIGAEQCPRPRMAAVLRDVSADIRDGASLGDALRRHRCFDRLTCNLVEVGEHGGNLDTVLERAADILARKRYLRTQTTTALIYPALVLTLAVATVAYMMVGVIPKLTQFLTSLGRQLPPTTQLMIDVSQFCHAHFVDGLVLVVTVVGVVWIAARTTPGRRFLDETLLRTPLVGRILRLAATASFSYNMALLVRSGVRITAALGAIAPLLPLRLFEQRVHAARERVVHGSGLSESLSRSHAFDARVTGMIAVGESSGRLDEVLENIAEFHDDRLRDTIRRLGTIIEPVILVVIGAIVGFVYLSFFSAVYSMAGSR
ncbi:MAG: type II secretion system F family protein [Planctomycetota bacterium JB042]